MKLMVIALFTLLFPGCGLREQKIHLTISQLRDLEQCVIAADDQVERQNCVERFFPSDAK